MVIWLRVTRGGGREGREGGKEGCQQRDSPYSIAPALPSLCPAFTCLPVDIVGLAPEICFAWWGSQVVSVVVAGVDGSKHVGGREGGTEGRRQQAINTYCGRGDGSAPTAQIRRRKVSSRQRCEVERVQRRAAAAASAGWSTCLEGCWGGRFCCGCVCFKPDPSILPGRAQCVKGSMCAG